ncbi:SDR family NAD(P)-dependent oxidoreductase [Streptomyces sp. NPDC018045]|uniref:SDR family NAD(P)-dependent oxidoreductase n=1 Tax=Streptomyces sp. NPDC018045 TaxID=3365037 RepID=UPI00379F2A6C
MDLKLKGKRAVVTGAGRGIGLAVAQALTAEGALVMGGTRTDSPALRAVTPHTVETDLATADGPAHLIGRAVETFGGLDILVNNVGGRTTSATGFLELTDEDWRAGFDLTFLSAVRAVRAALPALIESRGAIVNIGSVNGRLPAPRLTEYSAAKAALANLAKALSEEFGPRGVRVNTVSPGPVLTDAWRNPRRAERPDPDIEDRLAAVPRRMGLTTGAFIAPEEVAAMVVLLASGCLPGATGADWLIDAGMLKSL